MSIDFTKIAAEFTYLPDGIDIRIRELVAAPAPPPPEPVPVPPPAPPRWTYPEIVANETFGPNDVPALVALLQSDVTLGNFTTSHVVKLLGGVYKFPAIVRPRVKNVRFVAEHGADVVFDFNTSTGHGFYFTGASASSRVSFRRIRFTDLRTGESSQGGYQLVKFDTGEGITFIECEFDNCRASGIYANAGASGLYFTGCVIRDNGVSTQLDHGAYMHSSKGKLTFDRSFFVNNASHGLHCYDGSSSNVELIQHITVDECTFLSYGEPQDRPCIFQDATTGGKVEDIHVSGCMFFNAYPTEDPTEKDRNSLKFVNPVDCSIINNYFWNVPVVAKGVLAVGNLNVPPVTMALKYQFLPLDEAAHRYVVTVFNFAMVPTVRIPGLDLPTGLYEISSVAAPRSYLSGTVSHVQGEDMVFLMADAYSAKQHRAGGLDYGTHTGANAFRITRLPDPIV